MSLINIQDSLVKSQLVQQFADRSSDAARVQRTADIGFQQEIARQAEETVRETHASEQDDIRDGRQNGGGSRRRSSDENAQEEAEADHAAEEEEGRGVPPEAPHRLDITA